MSEIVQIKVLFFAAAKEISGKSEASLEVDSQISYERLLQVIVGQFGLEAIKRNIILAQNQDYCDEERQLVLKNNDEIAVIPPLSAG